MGVPPVGLELGAVVFPLFIVFEAGGVGTGEYTATVEVLDPRGAARGETSFPVTIEEPGDVLRIVRCCELVVVVDVFGVWRVSVSSEVKELARQDLMIKRAVL